MLSVFPELLSYGMVATALLRVTAGMYFFLLGSRVLRSLRGSDGSLIARLSAFIFGILEVGVGLLLVLGLFTQVAALTGIVLAIVALVYLRAHPGLSGERHTLVLLCILSFSLLFLGPGLFAFDLPL